MSEYKPDISNFESSRRHNRHSKFKGVTWDAEAQKWRAIIQRDGKVVRLGRFKTELEAAMAYNEYAIKHPLEKKSAKKVESTCKRCGKAFLVWPRKIRRGKGLYCSRACQNSAEPLPERFWKLVQKSEGCWLWQGHINSKNGYGIISIGPKGNAKGYRVHRVAWELTHGAIPENLLVCHHCDVPTCVNPEHLFLGTHKDNMADKTAKGRTPKGDNHPARRHPERLARGEKHYRAKVTEAVVLNMRQRYASKEATIAELAAESGLSCYGVQDIIKRRSWSHI